MENIGLAISIARKNLKLSKKNLADGSGVSPSFITKIENGRSMSFEVAQKIATALGLKLSQLLTIAESITNPENEIKDLQRKLLLSVQPILVKVK